MYKKGKKKANKQEI